MFYLRLCQHPGAVPQLLVDGELRLVEHGGLDHLLLQPGQQQCVLLLLGGGGHHVARADGVNILVQCVLNDAAQNLGL